MALKLKGSTSGFVAIDAPSVAGNNTLILPENTGSAHQILANDITAGVTTFTQITVSRNGDLTVPGTISIGGTLTYEDVTSVDSVGIVTARGLSIFGDTTGLNVASGISTFQGISLSGDTTGLKATGVSTFIDGTTIANSGVTANKITLPNSTDGSLNIGVGSVFKLNHNGTDSFITEVGGGDLYIQGNDIIIRDAGNLEKHIEMTQNGSVDLYHNGTKRLETLSGGAAVSTSNDSFAIGQGSLSGGNVRLDLHSATSGVGCLIRFANDHNGDAYIGLAGDTTGDLLIYGGQDKIQIKPQGSAAVELYHGDTEVIETISTGTRIPDGKFAKFGNSDDMSMGHNTYNYITYTGADLLITGDATNQIKLQPKSDEPAIVCKPNAEVELYHDATERAATASNGFTVKGNLFVARENGTTADYANMKVAFYQQISASASHTFQVGSVYAMGTVTIHGSRGPGANNATVATGKIFPIHVRAGATAGLGSQIGTDLGGASGGYSYSVAAASQGITVTNSSSTYAMKCFVTFDLTGFVG